MRYLHILVFCVGLQGFAQDPGRFAQEVATLQKKYDTVWNPSQETIVFTGSSSIRVWSDLEDRFPQQHIVNTGFGGSQASDLLAYTDDLILRFHPKMVFIYEGDNDLSADKMPKTIIGTTEAIITRIRAKMPMTKIVLISAKPSIARWKLKRSYKRLNRGFMKLGKRDSLIVFADVWRPMLDKRKVKQDIFIADGLHMNSKGYAIWYDVIKKFMEP